MQLIKSDKLKRRKISSSLECFTVTQRSGVRDKLSNITLWDGFQARGIRKKFLVVIYECFCIIWNHHKKSDLLGVPAEKLKVIYFSYILETQCLEKVLNSTYKYNKSATGNHGYQK